MFTEKHNFNRNLRWEMHAPTRGVGNAASSNKSCGVSLRLREHGSVSGAHVNLSGRTGRTKSK